MMPSSDSFFSTNDRRKYIDLFGIKKTGDETFNRVLRYSNKGGTIDSLTTFLTDYNMAPVAVRSSANEYMLFDITKQGGLSGEMIDAVNHLQLIIQAKKRQLPPAMAPTKSTSYLPPDILNLVGNYAISEEGNEVDTYLAVSGVEVKPEGDKLVMSAVKDEPVVFKNVLPRTAYAAILVTSKGQCLVFGGVATESPSMGAGYMAALNAKRPIRIHNTRQVRAEDSVEMLSTVAGRRKMHLFRARMITPRVEFAVCELPDDQFLIAGGMEPVSDGSGYSDIATCETMRFVDNDIEFSFFPAMHKARSGHAVLYLPNGTVLCAGGLLKPHYGANAMLPELLEIYDLKTKTWRVSTASSYYITDCKMHLLNSNEVLIVGNSMAYTDTLLMMIYTIASDKIAFTHMIKDYTMPF